MKLCQRKQNAGKKKVPEERQRWEESKKDTTRRPQGEEVLERYRENLRNKRNHRRDKGQWTDLVARGMTFGKTIKKNDRPYG